MNFSRSSPAQTDDVSFSQSSAFLPAIERLGLPIFLFGAVFLSMVILLTILITPDRFPVRIGDHVVRLVDLEVEQKKLLSDKIELTQHRRTSIESRAPVLYKVSLLSKNIAPIGQTLLAIDDVSADFRIAGNDPIVLTHVEAQGSGTILLGGEIQDVGNRSMQVLASFVDNLRNIPYVASISEPEYTQQTHADGGTVSPFSLTLRLTHASAQ